MKVSEAKSVKFFYKNIIRSFYFKMDGVGAIKRYSFFVEDAVLPSFLPRIITLNYSSLQNKFYWDIEGSLTFEEHEIKNLIVESLISNQHVLCHPPVAGF